MQNAYMSIKHPAAISLAFVLITGPLLSFADMSVNDTEACIQTLHLTPELAETGSYKIRVESCVRQRQSLRLHQDRNLRETLRKQKTLERITRNSKAVQSRITGIETPSARMQHWKQTYTGTEKALYSAPVDRPSRRSIKNAARVSTMAWKNVDAKEYQQRLLKAIDACKHHTSQYMRSNCVREEWTK